MPNAPTGWKPVQVNPKFRRQILQSGEKTMLVRVEFEAGAVAPVHSHPHEQLTYVASGAIRLSIEGVEHTLRAGDTMLIRGGVHHGAMTDEPAVVIDMFSPPREDFLASDTRLG